MTTPTTTICRPALSLLPTTCGVCGRLLYVLPSGVLCGSCLLFHTLPGERLRPSYRVPEKEPEQ